MNFKRTGSFYNGLVKVKKLNEFVVVPKYATSGSAGFDLYATKETVIMPGETAMVETGLSMEFEAGYELQIRPRSGMSAKTKIRVAFGTVDSDYRGEIKVICDNIGNLPYTVKQGDRIAQGVLAKYESAWFVETEELTETVRGQGGIGSTGK